MKTSTSIPDETPHPDTAVARNDPNNHYSYSLHNGHLIPPALVNTHTKSLNPTKKPSQFRQRGSGNPKINTVRRHPTTLRPLNNAYGSYSNKSVYPKAGDIKPTFPLPKEEPNKLSSPNVPKMISCNRSKSNNQNTFGDFNQEPLSSFGSLFQFAQEYYSQLHDLLTQLHSHSNLNENGSLQLDNQWHDQLSNLPKNNLLEAPNSMFENASTGTYLSDLAPPQIDDIAKASLRMVSKLVLSVSEQCSANVCSPKPSIENVTSEVLIDPLVALGSALYICGAPSNGVSVGPNGLSDSEICRLEGPIATIIAQTDKSAASSSAVISALLKVIMLQASYIGAFPGQSFCNVSDGLSQVSAPSSKQASAAANDCQTGADETTVDNTQSSLNKQNKTTNGAAGVQVKGEFDANRRLSGSQSQRAESTFEIPQIDLDDLLKPVDKVNANEIKCDGLCQRRYDVHPCVRKCMGIEKLHNSIKCCIRQELLKLRNKSPVSCCSSIDGGRDGDFPRLKPRSNTDWTHSARDSEFDLCSYTQFVDDLDLRPSWMKKPRLYSQIMDKISTGIERQISGFCHPLFYIEWNILGLGKQMRNLTDGSRLVSPKFQPTPVEGKVRCPVLAPLRMMITFDTHSKPNLENMPLKIGLGFTLAGDLDVCYRVFHPEFISQSRWHSFRERPWAGVQCCECSPLPLHYLQHTNVVTVGLIIEDLRPGGSIDQHNLSDNSSTNAKLSDLLDDRKKSISSASTWRMGIKDPANCENFGDISRCLNLDRSLSSDLREVEDHAKLRHVPMTRDPALNRTVFVNGQNNFEINKDSSSQAAFGLPRIMEQSDISNCRQEAPPHSLKQPLNLENPAESSSCAARAADLPCVLQLLVGYRARSKQGGTPNCIEDETCLVDGGSSADTNGPFNESNFTTLMSDYVIRDVLSRQSEENIPSLNRREISDEDQKATLLPLQTTLSKMELASLAVDPLPVIKATKCLFNRIWTMKGEHEQVE